MDHINKVKMLADQLTCLEVPVREENIVIILFKNFPVFFKYFITALEMMLMKELTMKYMTARLMHKMLKRKEKEPKGKDVAMVLR